MMWKILHGVVPNCCHIEFIETSRYGIKAVIPSLSKCSSLRNQSLYDGSFAVRGPKLWNKVPAAVKAEKSFDSFKLSLSKFLALIPDNPPVPGYTCSWSNSLMDSRIDQDRFFSRDRDRDRQKLPGPGFCQDRD